MGPPANCPRANPARKTVSDDVTAAVETWSDAAICGSDGSRILVARVPVAASAARTAICRKVEETSGSGAASIVATVWSVMEAPGEYCMMYIIQYVPGKLHQRALEYLRAGMQKQGRTVIARSKATKQSSFSLRLGLLRGACHRAAPCPHPLARNDEFSRLAIGFPSTRPQNLGGLADPFRPPPPRH